MGALCAIWNWLKRKVAFLDRHAGALSALATLAIAALTVFYVLYSKAQWTTMEHQLQLSERPWISLDLNAVSVRGSLTFNNKGGFIIIDGEVKNTGHSAALDTMVAIRMMDMSQLPKDWEMRDTPLCGQGTQPDQSVGNILFPGDEVPFAETSELYPKDIAYALTHELIKDTVMPIIVVCIRYRSVFDPEYHRTQYMYFLERPNNIAAVKPIGSIDDIRMIESFFGNLAD